MFNDAESRRQAEQARQQIMRQQREQRERNEQAQRQRHPADVRAQFHREGLRGRPYTERRNP